MLPVAVVLLVLILLFAVGAVVSNPEPVVLNVFVAQIPTNLAVVFIVGMATAIALIAALGLLWTGIRRQRAAVKRAPGDKAVGAQKSRTPKAGAPKSRAPKSRALKSRDEEVAPTKATDTPPAVPDKETPRKRTDPDR